MRVRGLDARDIGFRRGCAGSAAQQRRSGGRLVVRVQVQLVEDLRGLRDGQQEPRGGKTEQRPAMHLRRQGADQAGLRAAVRIRHERGRGAATRERMRRRDLDRSDRRDFRAGLQWLVQLSDLERPVLSRSGGLGVQGRQLRRAVGTLEGTAGLERCGRRVRHAGLDAGMAAIGQQPVRRAQGEQGQYAGLQQLEQQSARQPALLCAEADNGMAWSRSSMA